METTKMPEAQKENKVLIKHNKKRNTGLLFEFLTRFVAEVTMFGSESEDPNLYLEMMIRYFEPNTELGKELALVRSLAERRYRTKELAVRAIYDFKKEITNINHEQSNIEKSNLIKEINYSIGRDLYSVEVPSYRLYTSIYGLYEAIKSKNFAAEAEYEELVLENLIEASSTSKQDQISDEEYSDAVVSLMVGKLNEKFNNYTVSQDQRAVLQNYAACQQGDLSEESYRAFLKYRIDEIRSSILAMSQDPRLREGQPAERLTSLKEIFESAENIESLDNITSLVIEGLVFKDQND